MRITRQHELGREEAHRRVEKAAITLSKAYNLRYHWVGDDLKFDGTGVHGRITTTDSMVDVNVKLGFALMMLENTIRTTIEDTIDQNLA